MHSNASCFASSLVLRPLPFTSSRLSVLKKDSASALSRGFARPRHGLGDPMGLEAALERPGSVLGTLVVVEDEAEVVGRALPSDRPLERIRDRLLGHAPGHRPAHDLPVERVDRGCEAGPSFARSDAGVPPLLRRPQGAERLQRPEDDASQDREEWSKERNGDLNRPT